MLATVLLGLIPSAHYFHQLSILFCSILNFNRNACFWTVGGNWKGWQKPHPKTQGENRSPYCRNPI